MQNCLAFVPGTIVYHPILQYCHVIASSEDKLFVRYQDIQSATLCFKETVVPAHDLSQMTMSAA